MAAGKVVRFLGIGGALVGGILPVPRVRLTRLFGSRHPHGKVDTEMGESPDSQPEVPEEVDLDKRLAKLTPDERALLEASVEYGDGVPIPDHAALAVALARQRQRRVLVVDLPLYSALAIGVAVGLGLIVERNVALFVFLLVLGGILSVGWGWWQTTWRPLRRAEASALALLAEGRDRAGEGGHEQQRSKAAEWLGAAAVAWFLVFLVGIALGTDADTPVWVGVLAFAAVTVAVRGALARLIPRAMVARRSSRDS